MEAISKVARRLNHEAASEDDRGTERGDAIQKFVDRIDPGRVAMKLKPFGFGGIARKLKEYGCRDVQDIYVFYRKCEEFRVFSKGFNFLINQRKNEKKV